MQPSYVFANRKKIIRKKWLDWYYDFNLIWMNEAQGVAQGY